MTSVSAASVIHEMWRAVAGGWTSAADEVDERASAVTEAIIQGVAPRPGQRILELASGPGGVALGVAPLVGPSGEVVVSDVVDEMVAVAAERAAARQLTNVRPKVLDLDAIDEPDESFDAVVCREGLMFASQPVQAVHEIRRVLRRGGQASIAVWGPRSRNPWLGLVMDAVTAELGHPVPPPGLPGPFALDDERRLRALFVDAGYVDVEVTECAGTLVVASPDAWWARTVAMAGPLSVLISGLAPGQAGAIRRRLEDAAAPYATVTGLRLPDLALVVAARRPQREPREPERDPR
jgi:SAM-dependent methyltransferase